MILPAILGLIGISLFAGGTPRQAAALFGPAFPEARRRVLRIAGFACLGAGLTVLLADGGDARALTGWIGLLGAEALVVAIACSMLKARSARHARQDKTA